MPSTTEEVIDNGLALDDEGEFPVLGGAEGETQSFSAVRKNREEQEPAVDVSPTKTRTSKKARPAGTSPARTEGTDTERKGEDEEMTGGAIGEAFTSTRRALDKALKEVEHVHNSFEEAANEETDEGNGGGGAT